MSFSSPSCFTLSNALFKCTKTKQKSALKHPSIHYFKILILSLDVLLTSEKYIYIFFNWETSLLGLESFVTILLLCLTTIIDSFMACFDY